MYILLHFLQDVLKNHSYFLYLIHLLPSEVLLKLLVASLFYLSSNCHFKILLAGLFMVTSNDSNKYIVLVARGHSYLRT